MAWACHPHNIQVGMAAMIFVYAGVILLFIANLFFSQRIVRAQHPHFGWSLPFSMALPVLIFVIVATIICLIVAVILEFYSLSDSVKTAVRDIQIYGSTLYAVVAFLPIPVVGISTLARQLPQIKHRQTIDKFGEGSMRAKVTIVLFSAVVLTLGAAYRAGTTWLPPIPLMAGNPPRPVTGPWYFSRGSFYGFDFGLEIFMVWFWLFVRIDKRYIIPNGAKGPYSYGGGFVFAGEVGNEKPNLGNRDSMRHLTGSQTSGFNSQRASRVSWGGSRNSMAHESRVSWGGISREDVSGTLGEDGVQVTPYFDEESGTGHSAADVGVEGLEQEIGWDPKSGKWALRPISGMTNASPAVTRPHSTVENV